MNNREQFRSDLLRRRPGVRDVTLSHASRVRAGRSHPITVKGQLTQGTRVLWTGPRFFATMQIPILRGRDITESNRQGTLPVAVESELFARTNFGDADPIGHRLEIGGSLKIGGKPLVVEVIRVAANPRYGGLKRDVPPVVYVPYAQAPPAQLQQMT